MERYKVSKRSKYYRQINQHFKKNVPFLEKLV